MPFEQQPWDEATGEAFSAAPSLDLNFSFDPSLIESLPASIPEFFLAFDTPADHARNAQFHQQQAAQAHLLNAFQQQSLHPQSNTGGQDLTTTPSPSDNGPHHKAVGESGGGGGTTTHASGSGRGSTTPAASHTSNPGTGGGAVASSSRLEDVDVILKRQRNTIAARKYRQKRLDRIKELEDALDAMTQERDDLKLKLARQEAETAALKEMMRMKSGQEGSSN